MTDAAPEGFTGDQWVTYTEHWTNFAILLAFTIAIFAAAIFAVQNAMPVMSQPSPNTIRLHEDGMTRLVWVFGLMLVFLEVGGWAGDELQRAHDVKQAATAGDEA